MVESLNGVQYNDMYVEVAINTQNVPIRLAGSFWYIHSTNMQSAVCMRKYGVTIWINKAMNVKHTQEYLFEWWTGYDNPSLELCPQRICNNEETTSNYS